MMATIHTYRRPTRGWWRRSGYYLPYIAREISAYFLFGYALLLLSGLYRLTQGAGPFDAWVAGLAAPLALVFSAAALVFALVHTVTWFMVMPKTMPAMQFGDRVISERVILLSGLAICLLVSAAFLVLLGWWGGAS
jgi:fumarate reductase subunit C